MNIVHIYDGHETIYNGKGSLPRIVWNIAQRTAARSHEVTIIERRWTGLRDISEQEGVRFLRFPLRTGSDKPWEEVPYEMVETKAGIAKLIVDRTNFALRTLQFLKSLDFDVVHVHLPFAANVLVTIAPWLRSKIMYTAQLGELRLNALTNGNDASAPNVPAVIQRFSPDIHLAQRTAFTTVLNPNVKHIFEQNDIPSHKLAHIPNGVDVEKFAGVDPSACDRVRLKFGLDDRTVIFFAGTIMPRKGVIELIQAANQVIQAGHDDIRFVLAGEKDLDKSYVERIKSLINDSGINENIVFTGYLNDPDLLPMYKLSDIFVLPSYEEGFGMVVSEAMAAGTPPIASRINGVKQQVDDGTTGILVDPGSPEQLAEALNKLLDNPEKRSSMSGQSQQRAEIFGWERITDQYINCYKNIIARN